ncbi:MAG: tRNA epoxyqueuosine(34) reductase QueG, partial [Bradyrhizobium guangdongense]
SPLVRGAAVWALGQLLSRDEFAAMRATAIRDEHDESVREEWQLAS